MKIKYFLFSVLALIVSVIATAAAWFMILVSPLVLLLTLPFVWLINLFRTTPHPRPRRGY